MKTMIARVAVIGALLAAGTAHAQDFATYKPRQSMYILNYEVSSAVGSFSDKGIKDTSWRGIGFEGRSWLNDRFSVGFGFDFNRFSQTFSNLTTTTAGGGTLSGPVYRYADQFALKGVAHAYLLRGGPVEPYVGLGLGGVWSYAYGQTADLAKTDNTFDFIMSPEVGITLALARGASTAGLNLAFRYNYSTADFLQVKDAQTIQVLVGLFGAY